MLNTYRKNANREYYMTYLLCSCTKQKKELPVAKLNIAASTATNRKEQLKVWQEMTMA